MNVGELSILTTGCWNPYLENQITTATGSGITGYDLREKRYCNILGGLFVSTLSMQLVARYLVLQEHMARLFEILTLILTSPITLPLVAMTAK